MLRTLQIQNIYRCVKRRKGIISRLSTAVTKKSENYFEKNILENYFL